MGIHYKVRLRTAALSVAKNVQIDGMGVKPVEPRCVPAAVLKEHMLTRAGSTVWMNS